MSVIEDGILSERQELAEEAEPLLTFQRSVRSDGGRTTGYQHNIPLEIVRLLELDTSDDVRIECYQDGYVVRPADEVVEE
jgi:hypothetical protein